MFSSLCPFVGLVFPNLLSGFKGENLALVAPVPGCCFPFTFLAILCACGYTVRFVSDLIGNSVDSYFSASGSSIKGGAGNNMGV